MTRYYPINLNIRGKRVLIFGGGVIALRKADGLIRTGANVEVISKDFLPEFRELELSGKVKLIEAAYSPEQIEAAFLVIAATNEKMTNKVIAKTANEKNILVNDCSDKNNSSFLNPAVWEKEEIVLTFSTQGENPKLAKAFKDLLGEEFAGEKGFPSALPSQKP